MRRVMAQGVFDILHPGHLHYLEESRALGDELVVIVARDSNTDKQLHFGEEERLELVSALGVVDKAVLGSEDDIYSTVEKIDPDVITLGYDQDHSEDEVKNLAENATGHGVKVERISSRGDYSSRNIRG
ncbi:MAG: adenylyltransferase/cytidyltransferase family protein [Candidatus Nanohaloarchaea archaeon]